MGSSATSPSPAAAVPCHSGWGPLPLCPLLAPVSTAPALARDPASVQALGMQGHRPGTRYHNCTSWPVPLHRVLGIQTCSLTQSLLHLLHALCCGDVAPVLGHEGWQHHVAEDIPRGHSVTTGWQPVGVSQELGSSFHVCQVGVLRYRGRWRCRSSSMLQSSFRLSEQLCCAQCPPAVLPGPISHALTLLGSNISGWGHLLSPDQKGTPGLVSCHRESGVRARDASPSNGTRGTRAHVRGRHVVQQLFDAVMVAELPVQAGPAHTVPPVPRPLLQAPLHLLGHHQALPSHRLIGQLPAKLGTTSMPTVTPRAGCGRLSLDPGPRAGSLYSPQEAVHALCRQLEEPLELITSPLH